MILRDRDTNANGTLDERVYHLQNWRSDVVALVSAAGTQIEQVRYEPYGTPFGIPAGDTNADGDVTSGDVSQVTTWYSTSAYDIRGDLDMDGIVSISDVAYVAGNEYLGHSTGRGKLSLVANRKGYAGYENLAELEASGTKWDVRTSVWISSLSAFQSAGGAAPLCHIMTASFGQCILCCQAVLPRDLGRQMSCASVCADTFISDLDPRHDAPRSECEGPCSTKGVWGMVICVDGTPQACVCSNKIWAEYTPSLVFNMLFEPCVRAHEIVNRDCSACNQDGRPYVPESFDPLGPPSICGPSCCEAGAYLAHIECTERIHCGGDQACEAAKQQTLQHLRARREEFLQRCQDCQRMFPGDPRPRPDKN